MNDKQKALEHWHLKEHSHLPRTGTDATVGFEAGWDAREDKIKQLEDEVRFLLEIANWDNITRKETDKLILLYKKYERMDADGNLS